MNNCVSNLQGESLPQQIQSATAPGIGEHLQSALWRSPERHHFACTLDKQSGKFHNRPAPGIPEAVAYAQASSAMGLDVYFACAEYLTPESRTSQNAAGAWAFWADIDCGPGKPYSSPEEAGAAVFEFCVKAGLPMLTHIVNSGSGIHVYWALDGFVGRESWLTCAAKLKALMKSHGLQADPGRTADLASVLRVPGTLNHKYNPPKPVTLTLLSDEPIPQSAMLDAIDAAFIDCGVDIDKTMPSDKPDTVVPLPLPDEDMPEVPDLHSLESALKVLDPDCDERTWKFHRLAPLAYTARAYPELHDTLRELATRWSSGDLRGEPSWKWSHPGGNGLNGRQIFDRVWQRFLTDNYKGKRVTVGTIFYHAKEAGWVYVHEHSGPTAGDDKGAL